jgi:hypothetical protein
MQKNMRYPIEETAAKHERIVREACTSEEAK